MRRFLMVVAGICFCCVTAWGHAELDKSSPKVGEKVASAPSAVTIAFTEELKAEGSVIQVFDAQGKEVDTGDSHLDARDQSTMVVSLVKDLGAGKFTVKWHATVCV